jgi:hypothetical protein
VRRIVLVCAWLLVAAGGAALGTVALPRAGLHAAYFTNITRSGLPNRVIVDRSPSTQALDNERVWLPLDYSVEWSGFLVIDDAGPYEFSTISDDGSELEVDDQIVVRNPGPHGPQEARGVISLATGLHPFRVRYEQLGGGFKLTVAYARQGRPLRVIAPSVLLPDAMPYWEFRLRRAVPFAGAIVALLLWVVAGRAWPGRRIRLPLSRPLAIDRPAVAIAILIAVGVGVRIVMMLGSNAILWGDSDVFLETAGDILAGRFLVHDPFRTLLYPYFLSAFLKWSAEPPMDQVIVGAQHLLGVASTVCLYVSGRRAVGGRVALAGALLLSLHTTQLFYELSILSETFFTFMLAASLIPMTAFVERPSVGGAITTGVWCALLTLTRPVAQWLVVLPIGCAAWQVPDWKARAKVAIATALTFAAIMLPWAAVNRQQFGFFGIALGRGFGLFIRVFDMDGFAPQQQTAYPQVRDVLERGAAMPSPATYVRDELGDRRTYSMPQKDELMYRYAMEAVRRQPVRFALGSLRQWAIQLSGPIGDEAICSGPQGRYLCSRRTVGYSREPFLNRPRRDHEPVRALVVKYFERFRLPITLITTLAIFGVIAYAADHSRQRMAGLLLALVIAYLSFVPAFAQAPQDRYRLPIDGLLFMFAAFGVTQFTRLHLARE